jgi:hypothetical protein
MMCVPPPLTYLEGGPLLGRSYKAGRIKAVVRKLRHVEAVPVAVAATAAAGRGVRAGARGGRHGGAAVRDGRWGCVAVVGLGVVRRLVVMMVGLMLPPPPAAASKHHATEPVRRVSEWGKGGPVSPRANARFECALALLLLLLRSSCSPIIIIIRNWRVGNGHANQCDRSIDRPRDAGRVCAVILARVRG